MVYNESMKELTLFVYRGYDKEIGLTSEDLIYGSLEMFREPMGDSLLFRPALERTPSGKPYFFDSDIVFSGSHSGPYWVCLMGQGVPSLGIDVQLHKKIRDGLADRYFTAGERALLAKESAAFFSLWTRKEALVKYEGSALVQALSGADMAPEGVLRATYPALRDGHREEVAFAEVSLADGVTCTCAHPAEDAVHITLREMSGRLQATPGEQACNKSSATERLDPYERALRYLEHRAHTAQEVEKHLLEKGYNGKEAAEAVARLREVHYLDDAEYAYDYIQYTLTKRRGRRRICRELADKGVDREVVEAAFYRLEDEDGVDPDEAEWQNALKEAQRTAGERPLDERQEARVGRRLSALGYDTSLIYRVLAELRKGRDEAAHWIETDS